MGNHITGLLKWRANSLEETLMLGKTEGKRRRGWQRVRWLDSITHSTDTNWSKLQEWSRKELETIWPFNNTTVIPNHGRGRAGNVVWKHTVNTIVKTPIFFVLQSSICNTYKSLILPPSNCLWIITGIGRVGVETSAIAIKWSVTMVLLSIKGGERRVCGKNSLGNDMSISKSQRGVKLQTLSNGIPV